MPEERPGELRSLCKTVGLEPAPATLRGHWHLAGFYRPRAPHSTARVDWLRTTQSNGERASVTVNSCTSSASTRWRPSSSMPAGSTRVAVWSLTIRVSRSRCWWTCRVRLPRWRPTLLSPCGEPPIEIDARQLRASPSVEPRRNRPAQPLKVACPCRRGTSSAGARGGRKSLAHPQRRARQDPGRHDRERMPLGLGPGQRSCSSVAARRATPRDESDCPAACPYAPETAGTSPRARTPHDRTPARPNRRSARRAHRHLVVPEARPR